MDNCIKRSDGNIVQQKTYINFFCNNKRENVFKQEEEETFVETNSQLILTYPLQN